MAIDAPITGAATAATFDPHAWLRQFGTTGGAFALIGDGLHLWIVPGAHSDDALSQARKMISGLSHDQRVALTNHLSEQVGKSSAPTSSFDQPHRTVPIVGTTGDNDHRSDTMNMMTLIETGASGATLADALLPAGPHSSAWDAALADFLAKRDFAAGLPIEAAIGAAAIEEMAIAADHLIEEVHAPDGEAVRIKLDLARQRSARSAWLFEDQRNAIIADLRRLMGESHAEIAATPARGSHAICDDDRGLWVELPDLRTGRTLNDALKHLTLVAEIDPEAYPEEWFEEIRDVGGHAAANYPKEGARHLYVGQTCDKQMDERRQRCDALSEHMHSIEGMYERVGDFLERRGHCTDNRARDMRETTAAVRDFLAAGFRVFLHPDGKLGSGGSMPKEWFDAGPERSAVIEDAARRYGRVRRRWRNEPQIKRAIRKLGTVGSNGFIVLERKGS